VFPASFLFLVVPAALVLLLVAIPVMVAAAVIGLPYLLVRAIRRPSAA
jgi:type III secretory pathway component EscS